MFARCKCPKLTNVRGFRSRHIPDCPASDSKSLCHPILKLSFCIRFPRKFLEAPLLGILQTIVLPTGLLTTFTFWLIQIYFESYSHQSVEDSFDSESTGDMGYKSNSLWKVPPLVFLVKSKERISQRGDGARNLRARQESGCARKKVLRATRARFFTRIFSIMKPISQAADYIYFHNLDQSHASLWLLHQPHCLQVSPPEFKFYDFSGGIPGEKSLNNSVIT